MFNELDLKNKIKFRLIDSMLSLIHQSSLVIPKASIPSKFELVTGRVDSFFLQHFLISFYFFKPKTNTHHHDFGCFLRIVKSLDHRNLNTI